MADDNSNNSNNSPSSSSPRLPSIISLPAPSPTRDELFKELFALQHTCPYRHEKGHNCEVCRSMDSIMTSPKPTAIHNKTVAHDRLIMSKTGQYKVQRELIYESYEKPVLNTKLNIIHGTDRKNRDHFPLMPSLCLDMIDKNYSEPVRNRDKNWRITSCRDIVNQRGKEELAPDFMLDLGKYKHIDKNSPLFWAPEFQQFIRESRLFRTARCISGTV
jgi:hypothetical protein